MNDGMSRGTTTPKLSRGSRFTGRGNDAPLEPPDAAAASSPWTYLIGNTAVLLIGALSAYVALQVGHLASAEVLDPPTIDFLQYFSAGHLLLTGHPADAYHWTPMLREEQSISFPYAMPVRVFQPFLVYPPFAAVAFAPLAALPYALARPWWFILSCAALVAALYQLERMLQLTKRGSLLLRCAAFMFMPVFQSLYQGQISTFLLLAVVGGLFFAKRGKDIAAGVCLATLVTKPQYLVPVLLVLAVRGRWTVIASTCGTALVLLGIPTLFLGTAATSAYLRVLLDLPSWGQHSGMMLSGPSEGFYGLAHTLLPGPFATPVWLGISAAAMILLVWHARRSPTLDGPLSLGVVTGLLVNPHLLLYDQTLLLLPATVVVRHARWKGRSLRVVLALLYLALTLLVPLQLVTPVSPAPVVMVVLAVLLISCTSPTGRPVSLWRHLLDGVSQCLPQRPQYSSDKPRIAYVDGLRGIAIGLVLICHALIYAFWHLADYTRVSSHGWDYTWEKTHQGVSLFLVLSGFCLAYPALLRLRERRDDWFRPSAFFAGRALRILPPYLVALLLFTALSHVQRDNFVTTIGPPATWSNFLEHLLLVHNWTHYEGSINASFWSLALEWQWYWLFPGVLLCAVRTRWVGLVGTLGLALAWFSTLHMAMIETSTLPGRLFEFALGVAAAQLVVARRRVPTPILALGTVAPLAALDLWSSPVRVFLMSMGLIQPLHGLAFTCLLLLGSQQARVKVLLSSRPLVGLGTISYSVYLVQQPVIEAAERLSPLRGTPLNGPMAIALAILCGYVFYRLVEKPCLNPALRARVLPGLARPCGWMDSAWQRVQSGRPLRRRLLPGKAPA